MSSRDGNVRHQHQHHQQQYRRGIRSRGSFSFLRETPTIGPISSPLSCTSGLYAMQVASDSFADNAELAYGGDGYCGATPLHFAIANCRFGCAETLIRSGARKNIADSYGNTPVSLAAICDSYGNTPVSLAAICGDNDIAALLLDLAEPTSTFRSQRPAPINIKGAVPLGLALQLPSPDPSDVCFAEMLSDSPLFPGWGAAAAPSTPETPTALLRRQTEPAVKPGAESGGSNRRSAPATSPVLPRRHTAGEAESHARQIERPVLSPATSMWAMSRFRDTSPIGIRALSASQSQRESTLLRQGSSEHFASEIRSRSSAIKAAVPKRRPRHVNYSASVLSGGNILGDNDPLSAAGQPRCSQFEIVPRLRTPGRLVGLAHGDETRRSSTLSRNSSANSRRERSYTDSVIDKAWRNYLEEYTDDDGYDDSSSEVVKSSRAQHDPLAGDWSRPVPEPWMWRQAAMAIRNRRSQSLSANHHHRQTRIEQKRTPF
ncbi:hypothetical protein GGI15_004488 [Coemansia interrupta]|uniref:Uncharacterized protein n=1 Tax=Coemansia interrupta TaxID=1126814 RepID=A0A9W8HA71_9FUNG|nr:hypothetical protein GGI15_004488 [Coemansia interrupta]